MGYFHSFLPPCLWQHKYHLLVSVTNNKNKIFFTRFFMWYAYLNLFKSTKSSVNCAANIEHIWSQLICWNLLSIKSKICKSPNQVYFFQYYKSENKNTLPRSCVALEGKVVIKSQNLQFSEHWEWWEGVM